MRAWLGCLVVLAGCGAKLPGARPGGEDRTQQCTPPVGPADVRRPTTVIGTGRADSCDPAALDTALAAGGVITFSCGGPFTFHLTHELAVGKDTVLDGGGLITLSGDDQVRILALRGSAGQDTPRLTVQHVTLAHGRAAGADREASGGAILQIGGTVIAIDTRFEDNQAGDAGAEAGGGALSAIGGTTIIAGSTLTGNHGRSGGAIRVSSSTLTLVNTSLTGNLATGLAGDGGEGGGVAAEGAADLDLCGVTLSGNRAVVRGGGLFRTAVHAELTDIAQTTIAGNSVDDPAGVGGGLYAEQTHITLTASTVSGNTAHAAGGVFVGGSGGTAYFVNVTLTGNRASAADPVGAGGALYVNADGSAELQSTTIVGNLAGSGAGIAGVARTRLMDTIVANNLLGDGTAGNCANLLPAETKAAAGSTVLEWPAGVACLRTSLFADPLLDALRDNGGATLTEAPEPGSPAKGMGLACPAVDQRGIPRPASNCTLGAVE